MDKVLDVLEEVKASNALSSSSQAVVVIVREKSEKRKYGQVWGLG